MKWFDLLYPVALATVSGALGYTINEFQHTQAESLAQSMCIPKGHINAYVSKDGEEDYVCFMEDKERKKITKSIIVLPNRPLD